MKKILFAIIASLLLISCQTGNTTADKEETPIAQPTDPVITVVTQNPDPKEKKVVAKIPLFNALPVNLTNSRNVVTPINDYTDFKTAVQLTLVTGWGSGQEVTDGATFVKTVYGSEVTFTVSIDSVNNIIKYNGLFPDNEGTLIITYYPSTDTFDIAYNIIYDLSTDSKLAFTIAVEGRMKDAKIDGNFYSGQLLIYTYRNVTIPSTGYPGSQVFGYKISIGRVPGSDTLAIASASEDIQCVRYSDADTFPPVEPVTYDAQFWDMLLDLINTPKATQAEVNTGLVLGKWVDTISEDRNFNYTFTVDAPVIPETPIEEPEETP